MEKALEKKISGFNIEPKGIYFAGLIMLTLLLAIRIGVVFSYTPEITGIDNNFVYGVVRLLADLPLYPHPETPPYAVTLYPPLYFNLCYLFGKLFHISLSNPIEVYFLCRAVSLLCDIATSYLLYKLLEKNFALKKEYNILITASFNCIMSLLAYTFSRSDSLLLTFYAWVIYLLTKPGKPTIKTMITLSIISVAAIFSKQNGIILPFLVVMWYGVKKNIVQVLIYLPLFVSFFVITLLLYTKLLDYEYLLLHTVKGLMNRIDLSWFYVYIIKALSGSLLLVPLSLALAIAFIELMLKKNKTNCPLFLTYIFQILFSTLSALKFGSSLGYFNECFFLAFLIIAIQVKDSHIFFQQLTPYLLPVIVIFFIHVSLQNYFFFINKNDAKRLDYNKQISIKHYLSPNVENKNLLDLSNQTRNFFKVLFFKELLVPNFDIVDCCTLPEKSFDYTSLRNQLSNGSVRYIIVLKGSKPTEQWEVPLHSYKKDTSLYNYDIYKYEKVISIN